MSFKKRSLSKKNTRTKASGDSDEVGKLALCETLSPLFNQYSNTLLIACISLITGR